MIEAMRWLGILIMAVLRDRRDLALENLALRQQLEVLKRRKGVPRLQKGERVFWVMLSRIWAPWRQALHLVNGDTVVGWQRCSSPQAGFGGSRWSQNPAQDLARHCEDDESMLFTFLRRFL
jgi:hypothetical protein